MAFEVITTGKNEFWGKKREKKKLADCNLIFGLKHG